MTQIKLLQGDCLDKLKELEDNSVDSVVTDPPYHLTSIVKRFGKEDSAKAQYGTDGAFQRASKGFMGKEWDGGDIAFRTDVWEECMRVLKPGGHLLAFSHSRTYHRMAVAVEDAGFEIRDQIMWIYASGFPKSHNIGKKVDEYEGWGTSLKPAHEPIVMARKPFKGSVAQNVLEWGTGGINIDESRIGYRDEDDLDKAIEKRKSFANTGGGHQTQYVGGELKNPIDTTQSINTQGRFPANIIFDEEAGKILDEQSGTVKGNNGGTGGWMNNYIGGEREKLVDIKSYNDTGGASRFFYCPKVSKRERNEGIEKNTHPTLKPVDLMAYLIRLVTPKGGTVLDPFMGSGSTGKAAVREGFDFIGIEREDEYMEIAEKRIEHEQSKHNYRNFWE